MSLAEPHPLWKHPESGYEVKKAATVALMLSGRYMTDYHVRHWSRVNPNGYCQLCLSSRNLMDAEDNIPPSVYPLGTLEHLLLFCPSLNKTRENCRALWESYVHDKPVLKNIVLFDSSGNPDVQLLLDPTACPAIIQASQTSGTGILSHILYLCRTWCYSIHVRRRKILKLLNVIWSMLTVSCRSDISAEDDIAFYSWTQ